MKIRRARDLVCYWTAEGLQVSRPPARARIQLSERATHLLIGIGDWTTADDPDLLRHGFDGEQLAGILETLRNLQVIEVDEPKPGRGYLNPWEAWGPFAESYHAASRDADYVIGGAGSEELDEALTTAGPPPPQFKSYPQAPFIPLPRSFPALSMPVGEVFKSRRTHRDFADREMSPDQLAAILHHTFGYTRFVDAGKFGTLPLKASASAGGRHEAECYVVPLRVAGVPQALYHYDGLKHALELIDDDFTTTRLGGLVCAQEPCLRCGFVCFTTAVTPRLTWKYRHPRAYRLCYIDAGHYAQTFALATTALGLGAFQTIAFSDSAVEQALGLAGGNEPGEEFAVYVLAAGHPLTAPSGLPLRYRSPQATRFLPGQMSQGESST